jgi:hypothetical protein
MDEWAEWLAHLATMAGAMRKMKKAKKNAAIAYSLLADGLYWSDEFPEFEDSLSDDVIRFLIRYRTTLILGQPKKKLERLWTEAGRQFPEWIGFDAARRTPNAKLQALYHTLSQQAMEEFLEGFDPDFREELRSSLSTAQAIRAET